MSIKSSLFFASLFLALSVSSTQADYTSPSIAAEDEIDAAASRMDMKPLLMPDEEKTPSLREAPAPQPKEFATEEAPDAAVKLNLTGEPSLLPQVQEALDKSENITALLTLPVVSTSLVDEYNTFMLAKKIGFTLPVTEASPAKQSFWETLKQTLLKEETSFVHYLY